MKKIFKEQDILDAIMKDKELAMNFIYYLLKIDTRNSDNIYYTEDKNLFNINNTIYINFNISDNLDKKSGIYKAFEYYYKYLFSYIDNINNSIKDINFFYISLNNYNVANDSGSEIVLQVRERNTNEILIDNFNIICKNLSYYTKEYNNHHITDKIVLWLSLINSKSIKDIEEICYYLMDNDKKKHFINSLES